MADLDMLHTAEIVKAALPYVNTNSKGLGELFVKAIELMGSLRTLKSPANMAACDYEAGKIDMEGLLNGIRPVCNQQERTIVDQFLNFFNMKRMFEMYNNMMETMKTMQEFGGFSFGDSENQTDSDTVAGNFGSSNFESIFNSFKNTYSSDAGVESESVNPEEEAYHKEEDIVIEDQPATNFSGEKSNDKMFEMLKTMIPPDKASTFENLSMLLKAMSYDNNNK